MRPEEKLTDPGHHKEGILRDTLYHQDRYWLSREDTSSMVALRNYKSRDVIR